MRRLLAGLLTALLLSAGLVAATGTSASADETRDHGQSRCPYTGCVKTGKWAAGSFGKRKTIKVRFGVWSPSNAAVKGHVKVIVRRNGKWVRAKKVWYSGSPRAAWFTKLRRGRYDITTQFIPAHWGPHKRSSGSARAWVKGPR